MKSCIAEEIDREYKIKKSYIDRMDKFKEGHCYKCKNKNKNLCHVVVQINGKGNCAYFEEVSDNERKKNG